MNKDALTVIRSIHALSAAFDRLFPEEAAAQDTAQADYEKNLTPAERRELLQQQLLREGRAKGWV